LVRNNCRHWYCGSFQPFFTDDISIAVSVHDLGQRKYVLTYYSRLRAAAANQSASTPSLEATSQLVGGAAAKFRSVTYPQVSPIQHSNIFRLPPFGIVILILVYVGFVLGLEFVSQNVPGLQHRQAIGVRAGWLTTTQLPLLILLAGKANLIGFFTGVTYERLNVLHRWVARTMLLTATIHMGTQQALWSSLGLLQLEWSTDTCPPTGTSRRSSLFARLRKLTFNI
jgi:ferric-chelate reductase